MTTKNNFPHRLLYSMIRVVDLNRSIKFYTEQLGMTMFRTEEYPEGEFTLAFLGYGDEKNDAVIELTYNWGVNTEDAYEHGSAFGHIALGVTNLNELCDKLAANGVEIVRQPGPMKFTSPNRINNESIAFIKDPDGYRIEFVEDH